MWEITLHRETRKRVEGQSTFTYLSAIGHKGDDEHVGEALRAGQDIPFILVQMHFLTNPVVLLHQDMNTRKYQQFSTCRKENVSAFVEQND